KFGGQFEIKGTSWQGEAWTGYQDSTREYSGPAIRLSKMVAALNGRGGPNGNEWFNPFGSADPRSPYYVAGVTDNSQELVDWLSDTVTYRDTQDKLRYVDF